MVYGTSGARVPAIRSGSRLVVDRATPAGGDEVAAPARAAVTKVASRGVEAIVAASCFPCMIMSIQLATLYSSRTLTSSYAR
jgi:hypothetical protein